MKSLGWRIWVAVQVGCLLVPHELAVACPSKRLNPDALRMPAYTLRWMHALASTPVLELLEPEERAYLQNHPSALKRVALFLNDSTLWRYFEVALGLGYGGALALARYAYLRRDIKTAKKVIHQLRTALIQDPRLKEHYPHIFDSRHVQKRKVFFQRPQGFEFYLVLIAFTAFAATEGYQAFLEGPGPYPWISMESFLQDTLKEADPNTTLWLSPLDSAESLQDSYDQLANLGMEIDAVRTFFRLKQVDEKHLTSFIHFVHTPGEMCEAILKWRGASPIETIVISTHGNPGVELQFKGVSGPVTPQILRKAFEHAQPCQEDLASHLADHVTIVLASCALAQQAHVSSHAQQLAQALAHYLAPQKRVTVKMSRAIIRVVPVQDHVDSVNTAIHTFIDPTVTLSLEEIMRYRAREAFQKTLVFMFKYPSLYQLYRLYQVREEYRFRPPQWDTPQVYEFE